jgi:hypothetical protein
MDAAVMADISAMARMDRFMEPSLDALKLGAATSKRGASIGDVRGVLADRLPVISTAEGATIKSSFRGVARFDFGWLGQ